MDKLKEVSEMRATVQTRAKLLYFVHFPLGMAVGFSIVGVFFLTIYLWGMVGYGVAITAEIVLGILWGYLFIKESRRVLHYADLGWPAIASPQT